jgi:hypothetical protein
MIKSLIVYLISFFRNRQSADIVKVASDLLLNDFKFNKIETKKNRYFVDKATREDISNALWMYGHELTVGDNYLNTNTYYKRQFETVTRRIQTKSTREGYLYLFYIYQLRNAISSSIDIIEGETLLRIEDTEDIDVGAKVFNSEVPFGAIVIAKKDEGIIIDKPISRSRNFSNITFFNEGVYPLVLTLSPENSIVPLRVNNIYELVTLEPITLDMEPVFELDQDQDNINQFDPFGNPIYGDGVKNFGKPTWYLDNTDIQSNTTRHYLLSYELDTIEGADYFRYPETLRAFYNDVNQLKRKVEVPHFEPKLTISAPLGLLPPAEQTQKTYIDILTQSIINTTGVSGTGTQVSVAYSFTLANVTHIQFGTGRRTTFAFEDIQADYDNTGLAVQEKFNNENSYFGTPTGVDGSRFLDINDYPYGYIELNESNNYRFPLDYFILEKKRGERIIIRNHIFPYHKWSAFTEIALFSENDLVLYSSFPRVDYYEEMLSSCYLDLQITLNLKDRAEKFVLPVDTSNWIYDPDSDRWYVEILKDFFNVNNTFPNPTHNSGSIPMVFVYKFNNVGILEKILVDEIVVSPSARVRIYVTADPDGRFNGKIILL